MPEQDASRLIATVDRVEEKRAHLILREDCREIIMPSDLLPGTSEGEMVIITISRDVPETERTRGRLSRLIRRLEKG